MQVSQNEIFEILQDHKKRGKGKIFSATFTKKDGSHREMLCRFGVKSYLRGGEWANGQAASPEQHCLAIVFDMGKKAYRSIPIQRLHQVKINGHTYSVSPQPITA